MMSTRTFEVQRFACKCQVFLTGGDACCLQSLLVKIHVCTTEQREAVANGLRLHVVSTPLVFSFHLSWDILS